MKKLLFITCLLLFTVSAAYAAPFLRCDQYTAAKGDPDYFKVTVDSAAAVQSATYIFPNETGDSLHFDLAPLSVGEHTFKVAACKAANPPWTPQEVCSAEVPFSLTKPAPVVAPSAPANIGLSAQ